ncbi:unnamed protein product [Closterium sp. NIES-54]
MDGQVMQWLLRRMWRGLVMGEEQERETEGGGMKKVGAWVCTAAKEEPAWVVGNAMSEKGREAMQEVLARYRQAFAFTLQELGKCSVKEMELKLVTDEPVFQRKQRMTPADEDICKEKCKELLEAGLIQRSESEYATPTVVAARKDLLGEVLSRRMCGDYRALNKVTVPDRYPMPTAEDIFDRLGAGEIFTTLDLRHGFNQIRIRKEDVRKTAFHGADGLYEWLFMPFGLRNASAIFQRVMDSVLRGLDCAACYIDDVVIFSKSEEEHVRDVERTLKALADAGLTCHPKKCRWGEATVQYLGYEVRGGQIGIQQAKIEVLNRLQQPKDRSGLRAVLGFLSYYRRFVPNFSKRATALNGLLKEDRKWEWGTDQEVALRDLMEAVQTATILQLPKADKPFCLYTDWSSQGMGAILCQELDGEERVVAYASRSCNPAEAKYSSYHGEGLAAVWAVKHFRVYLQGREFTLITDHQPLQWLMTHQGLTGRNARWAVTLQEYDFKIRHRPGKTLQHVDGLSRNPPPPEPVQVLMMLARQGEKEAAGKQQGPRDIWEDAEALRWVKGETEGDEQVPERARARGNHYRWYQGQLQLQSEDGWKLVPAPGEREGVIEEAHRKLGHFGHERTMQLLKTGWWWDGMRKQVKEWVSGCEGCQRSKASLMQAKQELQSLPIRGLGFRWSLDLAGELPLSRGGQRYILLMVEHASKWLEVWAIPSKDSRHVAKAFKEQVLCRFGAPGEVLTDQGTEFRGEFQALLDETGITHRLTSRYHPQSDGLTERLVQTLKRNLRAYGEQRKRKWDEELHWIAAGYRFGKQASLKDHSPYSLLFGNEPILPVGAPRVLTDTVSVEGAEKWVALAEARARYMREMLPAALENLHTAQLRDARRYEQRQQQGGRKSKAAAAEGQEVYLRRARKDTLDVGLGTERWKVKEIRGLGVLVLENEKGERTVDHQTNAAVVKGQRPQQVGPVIRARAARARAQEGAGSG